MLFLQLLIAASLCLSLALSSEVCSRSGRREASPGRSACVSGVVRLDPSLVEIETEAFFDTMKFELEKGSVSGIDFTGCDKLTTIGSRAFMDNQITSLTIGSAVTVIKEGAFAYNKIYSLNFGPSVITIGQFSFAYNRISGSLTIPSSVTTIENSAFESNEITALTIGSSVHTIGEDAFISNKITSLVIPASVNSIGHTAFAGNPLTSACYEGDVQPSFEISNPAYFGIKIPFIKCKSTETPSL